MRSPELEAELENLNESNYQVQSPRERRYNCIAWAMGENHRWWWPSAAVRLIPSLYYWPPQAPLVPSVESFRQAFATKGFETCNHAELEAGYVKVALFVSDSGHPTHAARQLEDGTWTSKLGEEQDIQHTALEAVAGRVYGDAAFFFRKEVGR